MVKKARPRSRRHHRPQTSHRKLPYMWLIVLVIIGVAIFFGGILLLEILTPCANTGSCHSDLTEKIENGAIGTFQGHAVAVPDIYPEASGPSTLGTNVPVSSKHIYVDLSAQKIYAYEGTSKFLESLTATGRWGKTPTGNFNIWSKLRSTRMTGGSGADYYNLPNVPFVMYFYHDFGLHGAYWHDNFGHTMSHGCVNLRPIDAEALFNWTDGPTKDQKGTAVSVCDQFIAPSTCIQNNPVNQ